MTPTRMLVVLAALAGASTKSAAAESLLVEPAQLVLDGALMRAQLLVRTAGNAETAADRTTQATYASSRPDVAAVGPTGQLLALADGESVVRSRVGAATARVPVRVAGARKRISYDDYVQPILSKAGCNAGACHAAQYGKGGFKLSVFGDEPQADHRAMLRDALGRRVDCVDPAQSLLLLKPGGALPHGGGVRFDVRSADFRVLRQWIEAGAPAPEDRERKRVAAVEVTPRRRLGTGEFTQQLRVVATYGDGTRRDVTHWAHFSSLDEGTLRVSSAGLVTVFGRGQGTAMARFEGKAAVAQFVVPYGPAPDLSAWKDNNFIDRLAAAKFRELGLTPAPLCDDGAFLRRAYLDATGTTPTVEEARKFLDSTHPNKRRELIDRLLGRSDDPSQNVHDNAYAAWWSLRWADLLRSSSAHGEQIMWVYHNWLQESFRKNQRLDAFARELLTARGSTAANGPANFYSFLLNNEMRTEATAQVFLGVRVQCAQCHHHPFEAISQADYYRLAAFFARVGTKALQDFGVRDYNADIVNLKSGEIRHPRTGEVMPPTPLHGGAPAGPGDRRQALAAWITSPENPYFARNIANRYWAQLLGRGLVEPVDDMRLTNPPTNPELLDALAQELIRSQFDVKQLLRVIMNSRLYQLDATPPKLGGADGRWYASFRPRRVAAEPLSDAIDALTGVPTQFKGVPLGTRAIELPDGQYDDNLLRTFGKPKRESVCECERVGEPNLAQALHTLNSARIFAKAGDPKGRLARLLTAKASHDSIVEELYLAALSRRPTAAEQSACRRLLSAGPGGQEFYEDLLWSLINSKQFLFVH